MLKNYCKTAWRNIRRNKLLSAINILGLSIGIALCYIIMLYVQNELSYDSYNKNAGQIARIIFKSKVNGGKINESAIMAPVAETMKKDFPEVKDAVRIMRYGSTKIFYKDKVYKDDQFAFADPNIFSIFTLPLVKGDPTTALRQPNTVVISETTAKKYFGEEEALGKTLAFTDSRDAYTVTGVMRDIPSNSHFHFDMLTSMMGWKEAGSDSWMYGNFYTYLLLQPGTDLARLEAKLPGMVEKYMGPQILKTMGVNLAQFRTKGNFLGFALQPLSSIHLHSDTTNEMEPGGDGNYVYIFGGIAIFMLLVACINFINLSTASASRRAKEVGIRKVAGSGRGQLIFQFLSESVIITIFSLLVAITLVQMALPAFNAISGKHLSLGWQPVLAFVALGMLTGIIAGIYPAFYLSAFKPVLVLKGRLTGGGSKGFSLRSGLVVFQFFISVSLIIGTIVVFRQMSYIQNRNLGYDKTQLITLPNSYALGGNEKAFRNDMLNDGRVLNATLSWYKPAGPTNSNNSITYAEGHENQLSKMTEYRIDDRYIPTMGMEMAAGRNFSYAFGTDSNGVILNEAAAKAFGWDTQGAIGKQMFWANDESDRNKPFHVIGVVKDFNFKSLHEPISPLLMTFHSEGGLIVKIKTKDVTGLLTDMKKKWESYTSAEPFTYSFLDELYAKTYATEQKTGTILNIFSVLTIFVACLGLFGLAAYTAGQRTKEIGIRKVLGASVTQVIGMLSRDFLALVLVASLIAFPVAWWAMNKWLQTFAYRIEISWTIFLIAGLTALLVALLTVSAQAIKAAIANPVRSLKSE